MRMNILMASVVVTAGLVGAAGPASAMMRQAPLAAPTGIVLVQDQQKLQQEQLQRQQLLQREQAAKQMRRAAIKRDEAKIIGAVKQYLGPEYERYYGNQGGGSYGGGMGGSPNR